MSTLHVPIVLNGGSNIPEKLEERELFLRQSNGNSFLHAGIGTSGNVGPVAVSGLGNSTPTGLVADDNGEFINLNYLKYGMFEGNIPTLILNYGLKVKGEAGEDGGFTTLSTLNVEDSTIKRCTLESCCVEYGSSYPLDPEVGQLFFYTGTDTKGD